MTQTALKVKRISEYDVIVEGGSADGFAKAMRQGGFKAWKLATNSYQISFDGHPAERAELPAIGSEWTI